MPLILAHFGDSCCGYAALEVVKRVLGVHSFFLVFGSASWLFFFHRVSGGTARLWFYHVGKFAKCVHRKYGNKSLYQSPFSITQRSRACLVGMLIANLP
jgi:hypothetical protein